jgi:hypothetical protein
MTRPHHRSRIRRSAISGAATLSVVAGLAGAAPVAGAAAPTAPALSLIAATASVTLDNYDGEGVYLDLGTYITANGGPLEFQVKRGASYKDPVFAKQIIRDGKKTRTK